MKLKERKEKLLNKLSKIDGKAIVLAGLVLLGSASIPKVKADTQMSGEPEIKISDLMNKNTVSNKSFVSNPQTKMEDVKDDEQVMNRAVEVYSILEELGYTNEALPIAGQYVNLEKEDIFNLIKLLGGQNPYGRPVEHEDIFFNANILDAIMSKESTDAARAIEGISAPEMELNGQVFPYSYLVQDDHRGKKIVYAIEYLRHGMIKNPTKDGAYPYAQLLAELIYRVYLTNGYGGYPSYYQAETSGERFLGLSLAMQTADMAARIGKHIGFQNYAVIDGKETYCDIDIKAMIEELNQPVCPVEIITDDGKQQTVMMNAYSETLTGVYNEANGKKHTLTLK